MSRYDAIIVGAGFAGLYMLYKLRDLGFSARVLEAGDGIGGTWFWNRYPGARCDVESTEYSYSFSPEIEQEWEWTELMAGQPEIEAYINFVADRLDLRKDIQINTRVIGATFSEALGNWTIETASGERFTAQFCIMATGCLSVPLEPQIEGLEAFAGIVLRTGRWPREVVDLSGKRVGVIGTGSSGVQCIPTIAEAASKVVVFQRSAAFTRPANNRPLLPGELADIKADYPRIRALQRESPAGALRIGAVTVSELASATKKIRESSPEERLEAIEKHEWSAPLSWTDIMVDPEANALAVEMYGELVRRVVKDPATAASLLPHYPLGCKRQVLDTNYFETFNQDHVTLVDLRAEPIAEVIQGGVRTSRRTFDLDVLVLATGFDAMTGALTRIEIAGRGGRLLADYWGEEGPKSYLGLQIAGYPNLFTITGPGSPSVATNMIVSIEQHVEWIAACLEHLRRSNLSTIEPTEAAQEDWVEHAASVVAGRVYTWETCNSWYLGANVPGKKRVHMPYRGGLPAYRRACDDIAANGYRGFHLGASESATDGAIQR